MVRYEKYKDSGIAWIGEIPKHWRIGRIKRLGRVLTGTTPSTSIEKYFDCEDISWYTPTDFSDENIYLNNSNRHLSQTVLDEKIVQLYPPKCVLLIGIGGTLGRIGYAVDRCYSNQQINAIVFNSGAIPLYYAYSLQPIKAYIWSNANTATMPILNQSATKNLFVAIPPTTEQEQIAKYLDWKCGEVDRIVEVRERQIKLLGELRTSVISRAVTRGLNPNAPLKDSGIDWIGQIPEHWEIKKVKFTGKAIIGLTYSPNDIIDKGGSIVLRSTNIQNGVLDLSDKVRVNSSISEKLKIRKGDVLLCSRNGSASLVGKCAYIGDVLDGVTWGAFTTVLRSSMKKYLYYALNSDIMKFYLGMFSTSTINQLTTGTLNNMELLIPPATEQQQIADYLDKKTAEIDSTINKFKVQIDKLKEYKQALITEVVTGKIDVRGIEIPTPKNN